MLAGRELDKLYREFPQLQVEKIDILTHPRRALAADIRMIPALKAGDRILAGFLLQPAAIRKFVLENTPAPKQ